MKTWHLVGKSRSDLRVCGPLTLSAWVARGYAPLLTGRLSDMLEHKARILGRAS